MAALPDEYTDDLKTFYEESGRLLLEFKNALIVMREEDKACYQNNLVSFKRAINAGKWYDNTTDYNKNIIDGIWWMQEVGRFKYRHDDPKFKMWSDLINKLDEKKPKLYNYTQYYA